MRQVILLLILGSFGCASDALVKSDPNGKLFQTKTPKIFIQSVEYGKNIASDVSSNITNLLTLKLINQAGERYIVMNDSTMRSLLNQTSLQLSGFGGKEGFDALRTVADFDILIAGSISKNANQYSLTIKAVKPSSRAEGYEIYFSDTIDLFPYQFDYYADEIAKKSLDSKYTINKLNAPEKDGFNLSISKIKIESVSSEKMNTYSFEGTDSSLRILTDEINDSLLTADRFASQKRYGDAIDIYVKSLKAVQSLSSEYQNSLSNLQSIIRKNIDLAYFKLFQERLIKIDRELNAETILSEEILSRYYATYQNLLDEINNTSDYQNKSRIQKTLRYRIAEVKIAFLKYSEKEADDAYQKLNFAKSHKLYKNIFLEAQKYTAPIDNGDFNDFLSRIEQKRISAEQSGFSYLNNTVRGLLEMAESENARGVLELSLNKTSYKGHILKSIKYVEAARSLLEENEIFTTDLIITKYNTTAENVNQHNSKIRNYGLTNIILVPFRYVGNIIKGVADIFVFKFGYGIGVGTEIGPLGTGLGIAYAPIEVSSSYTKRYQSRISSVSRNTNISAIEIKRTDNEPWLRAVVYAGINTCVSIYLIRICDELPVYSTINVWLGFGPAMHMSIETHRLLEFVGVLFFQDIHILKDENKRFHYFSHDLAKKY